MAEALITSVVRGHEGRLLQPDPLELPRGIHWMTITGSRNDITAMSASLKTPAWDYRESYQAYVDEFVAAGEPLIPFVLQYPTNDFQAFLDRLHACKMGSETG